MYWKLQGSTYGSGFHEDSFIFHLEIHNLELSLQCSCLGNHFPYLRAPELA